MGKNKKRIISRKKRILKKAIKHIKKAQGKTSEQQSRENEMIKTMLMRQQPATVGQTQQTDKLQQQIDTFNKTYTDKTREAENLKRRADEMRQLLQGSEAQLDEIKKQIAHENKLMLVAQHEKRKREQAKKQLEERKQKREEVEQSYKDAATEAADGAHEVRMELLKFDKQQNQSVIDGWKQTIKDNKMFNEYKIAEMELQQKEAEKKALEDIVKSQEFNNPNEALAEVMRKKMLAEYKKKHYEEVIKEKENISRIEAEGLAYQEYYDELTKGGKIPVLDENGNQMRKNDGTPIYKLNNDGTYELDKSKALLAIREKTLAESRSKLALVSLERDTALARVEAANELIKDATMADIESDKSAQELKAAKKYFESNDFKNMMNRAANAQEAVVQKQAQNESMKQNIAASKQLAELDARKRVLETFDPSASNPEAVQAQIGEYIKQVNNEWDGNIQVTQQQLEHNRARDVLFERLNKTLEKYDEGWRGGANENLMRLIMEKTQGKLPEDIMDWDYDNTIKASDFVNFISKLNPNLLTDNEIRDSFIDSDDFRNFDWNVV